MRIYAKQFGTLKSTGIDFPETGIVQIKGKNGSGKSAIIDILSWCLWGITPRGTTPDEPDAAVNVKNTVLRRTKDSATRDKVKLNRSTLSQEMTSLLGDQKTWAMSCLLSNQSASRLTDATPAVRTVVLEELLDMEDISRYAKYLKNTLNTYTNTLKYKEQGLCQRQGESRTWAAAIAGLEAELAQPRRSPVEAPSVPDSLALLPAAIQARDQARMRLYEARTAMRNAEALIGGRCPTCGQEKPATMSQSDLSGLRLAYAAAQGEETRTIKESLRILDEKQAYDRALADYESYVASERVDKSNMQARLESYRASYSDIESKIDTDKTEIAELDGKVRVCEFLYRLTGSLGYKVHRMSGLCTDLTNSADYWLNKLCTTNRMSVRIETKQANQKAYVDIITCVDGIEKPYEACSSGQQRRINLAIMLGLTSMDRASKFSWSPIFVDEVLDTLDAEGRHAAFDCLQELAERRCVVLISHVNLPTQPDYSYTVIDGKIK